MVNDSGILLVASADAANHQFLRIAIEAVVRHSSITNWIQGFAAHLTELTFDNVEQVWTQRCSVCANICRPLIDITSDDQTGIIGVQRLALAFEVPGLRGNGAARVGEPH